MGDIIELRDRIARMCPMERDVEFDAFLIVEGLDLLAAFRSLPDPVLRDAVLRVVRAAAASSGSQIA